MHVRTDRWTNGAWNIKLPQFRQLAEMLGVDKLQLSLGEVQELIARAASEKVFAENIKAFLEASGMDEATAKKRLERIEGQLGLLEPLPFMSLDGIANPREFHGVAIWPAGTASWTELRLEQIRMAARSGAHFSAVICLGSSRICNQPADKAHWLLKNVAEGSEPDERKLQKMLKRSLGKHPFGRGHEVSFQRPELPKLNEKSKPLTLSQQLEFFKASGQYDELIGDADIYVPANPNALYVPLHVRRVLGRDNVWFSQAGARVMRTMPYPWPSLQNVMTTPNGILRLWVELLHAGCITER